MSIFDVIRYPISMPPTEDELERLPDDLFNEWKYNSDWKQFAGVNRKFIAKWYRNYLSEFYIGKFSEDKNIKDIEYLKELIQNYNDNL